MPPAYIILWPAVNEYKIAHGRVEVKDHLEPRYDEDGNTVDPKVHLWERKPVHQRIFG